MRRRIQSAVCGYLPLLVVIVCSLREANAQHHHAYTSPAQESRNQTREAFINDLVTQMTVPELTLQLYLTFADSVIGPYSNNSLYDEALPPAPSDTGLGGYMTGTP